MSNKQKLYSELGKQDECTAPVPFVVLLMAEKKEPLERIFKRIGARTRRLNQNFVFLGLTN